MGLLTIAEGVESDAISQKLHEIGVDYAKDMRWPNLNH
jgi:EAL domain-containing protein (putative c-di-GMP-specific phosphodiesterase class I)